MPHTNPMAGAQSNSPTDYSGMLSLVAEAYFAQHQKDAEILENKHIPPTASTIFDHHQGQAAVTAMGSRLVDHKPEQMAVDAGDSGYSFLTSLLLKGYFVANSASGRVSSATGFRPEGASGRQLPQEMITNSGVRFTSTPMCEIARN